MQHVMIRVGALKDRDKPLFPEYAEKYIEGKLVAFSILEAGMVSGKTSCAVMIELPDGSVAGAELSADMMEGLAAATRGAVARFGK